MRPCCRISSRALDAAEWLCLAVGQMAICMLVGGLCAAPALAMPVEPVESEEVSASPARSRERHLLLRFVAEMEAAETYLQEARSSADPTSLRRRFDYDRLTDDLQLMRHGVIDYLRQSGAMRPRSFEPLSGHYAEKSR